MHASPPWSSQNRFCPLICIEMSAMRALCAHAKRKRGVRFEFHRTKPTPGTRASERGWRRGLAPWILKFDIFLFNFQQKKAVLIVFELVKWNYTTVGPPGKNVFGHPWKKSTIGPPLEKNPPTPMTRYLYKVHSRRCLFVNSSSSDSCFFPETPLVIAWTGPLRGAWRLTPTSGGTGALSQAVPRSWLRFGTAWMIGPSKVWRCLPLSLSLFLRVIISTG